MHDISEAWESSVEKWNKVVLCQLLNRNVQKSLWYEFLTQLKMNIIIVIHYDVLDNIMKMIDLNDQTWFEK